MIIDIIVTELGTTDIHELTIRTLIIATEITIIILAMIHDIIVMEYGIIEIHLIIPIIIQTM